MGRKKYSFLVRCIKKSFLASIYETGTIIMFFTRLKSLWKTKIVQKVIYITLSLAHCADVT